MLYQFLDWRYTGRQMCTLDVAKCFARLRAANQGVLPLYLDDWDTFVAFAGEARIALPESEEVARSIVASTVLYPTLGWISGQYAKLLVHVAESDQKHLLKDPEPDAPVVVPLQFQQLLEGSTSNLEDAGTPCSEPSPAIFSPTGMSPGSPNALSMGRKQSPKVLRQSTPTLVPRHLCERLKAK